MVLIVQLVSRYAPGNLAALHFPSIGQAVIQIAAARGLQTVNLIRDRPQVDELRIKLYALGASRVLTYDELADKAMKAEVKAWTMGKVR